MSRLPKRVAALVGIAGLLLLAGAAQRPLAHPVLADCRVDTYWIDGLDQAGDLTQGPDGNMWITQPDVSRNSIAVISPDAVLVHNFPIPTGHANSWSIVVGPDGNLWFLETDGNKVGRITPAGDITEYAIPTPDAHANEMTVGPDGNLWFGEGYPNKIARLTTDGQFTEFQLPPLTFPWGITPGPDGTIWFTEYYRDSIGRINVDGSGYQDYRIYTPDGLQAGVESIAQGSDGNLYFNEWLGKRIGVITPNGDVTQYDLPASLDQPHRVKAGPDGNVWFSALHVGRITPAGAITQYPGPRPGYNIGLADDGSVWFTPNSGGNLARISGC